MRQCSGRRLDRRIDHVFVEQLLLNMSLCARRWLRRRAVTLCHATRGPAAPPARPSAVTLLAPLALPFGVDSLVTRPSSHTLLLHAPVARLLRHGCSSCPSPVAATGRRISLLPRLLRLLLPLPRRVAHTGCEGRLDTRAGGVPRSSSPCFLGFQRVLGKREQEGDSRHGVTRTHSRSRTQRRSDCSAPLCTTWTSILQLA